MTRKERVRAAIEHREPDMMSVGEWIIDYEPASLVLGRPTFLRGKAQLVVDLRRKLGMSRTEMQVNTCIIITLVNIAGEETIIGALADSVQEVVEILPENIDSAPTLGTCVDTRFIKGIAKRNDRFVLILDINEAFSSGEIAELQLAEISPEAEEASASNAPMASVTTKAATP